MSEPEKSEAKDDASEKPPVPAESPSAPSAEAKPAADTPADEKAAVEAPAGETSSEAGSEDAPTKKKKKKKKRSDVPQREELDADGRERPTFVLTFPSDPSLDHAVKAFELGDYATVRTEASKLLDHPSKDVRAAAGELLRRIEPDPMVKILLAMAVVLLLVVTFWAYRTHGVH